MKAVVISQAKSGTYLCANLLQNFGMEFTYMHLGERQYEQYDKNNLEESRENPRKYTQRVPLTQSVKNIGENGFAVCHISKSNISVQAFSEFKKILLYRKDETQLDKSWSRWLIESGRGKGKTQKPFPPIVRSSSKTWIGTDNTFELTFEQMLTSDENALNNLQIFLFNEIKYNSVDCIKRSLEQDSLTKSSLRK